MISDTSPALPLVSSLRLGGMHAGVRLQLLSGAKEDPKKSLGGHTDKKGIDTRASYVV